ncbi:MAG: hypothetical protein P0116_08640 [Candidatus Nitrosocosmicus sp.]|nr:hypothetical protein [Candidatus Nitrosocosmicus sp.]
MNKNSRSLVMDVMNKEVEGFMHSVTRNERDKISIIGLVQLKSPKDNENNGNTYYNYKH